MTIITDISDNSVLHQKAARVVDIGAPQIGKIIDQMIDQMQSANGIGLAAPQIGELIRICVFDIAEQNSRKSTNCADSKDCVDSKKLKEPLVCINPVITKASRELLMGEEGCLSLPKLFLPIIRSESVTVRYYDRQGQKQTICANDLLAVALQHEIDHLDGILITDRHRAQTAMRTEFAPVY